MKNAISYFEIQAANPEKWEFTKDTTIPVDYWRIKTEGMNGGLLKRLVPGLPLELGTNAFVCSVWVEDFDIVAEKIVKNGGNVALEKFAVPGKCWQGYFLDTEQNTFGLFQVDENAR